MLFTERCNRAIYFVNVSQKSNENLMEFVSNLFVVAQLVCARTEIVVAFTVLQVLKDGINIILNN